ncbi:hypothetical protein H4S02_009906, partial [Coemansia sp. RSA 2611]
MSSPLTPAAELLGSDSSTRALSRPATATASATDAKASREARARRRNTVRESVRTKARFDSLVLRWQEKLLEPATSELLLRQAAQYLTPDDFDSVILERTSGDLCGYPLCARATRKLEQRYHISLRQRKLFDMEEHASYCSNRCMVGSRFYRQQLSEEPVYMRSRKENLDIEVLPLSVGDNRDQVSPAEPNGAPAADSTSTSDQSLINWYRDSLLAKMNIPKRVADANPLQIVEHTPTEVVDVDLSAAVGKLQFADIEGFEPEADRDTASRGSAVPARGPVKKGSELLRRVAETDVESSPSAPPTPVDATPCDTDAKDKDSDDSEAEESTSDGDEDEEADDNDSDVEGSAVDSGHFAKLVETQGSHVGARPALSLFGRMWMLADRITSEKTQKYLRDLKQASDTGMLNLNMA